ncbi:13272_t:CDS:1, partial [Racocetra fulgida]
MEALPLPLEYFNFTILSQASPLFEYTNFITPVTTDLYDGREWLSDYGINERDKLENAIKGSLIKMILRSCEILKHLYLKDLICDHKMLNNTTINSVDFYIRYGAKTVVASKAIYGLGKNFEEDTTSTSLNMKLLLISLCKNSVPNTLEIYEHQINDERGM